LCWIPGTGSPSRNGTLSAAPNRGHDPDDVVAFAFSHRRGESLELGRLQHVALRKREPEDRVVGDTRPIDQLLDDVVVGSEREYVRDDAHRETILRGEL
jgi:hypothetical protein